MKVCALDSIRSCWEAGLSELVEGVEVLVRQRLIMRKLLGLLLLGLLLQLLELQERVGVGPVVVVE